MTELCYLSSTTGKKAMEKKQPYDFLIDVHCAPLAAIVHSSNGMYIATASEQGTIIRVHLVSDATKETCGTYGISSIYTFNNKN